MRVNDRMKTFGIAKIRSNLVTNFEHNKNDQDYFKFLSNVYETDINHGESSQSAKVSFQG